MTGNKGYKRGLENQQLGRWVSFEHLVLTQVKHTVYAIPRWIRSSNGRGDREGIFFEGALVLKPEVSFFILGQSKPLPSVYIQMDFKFTWKEFCLLETYFKTKISELIVQKNGDLITFSQLYLNNFDENCPAARNNTEKASLLFYIVKSGGTYQDVDKELTRHAFEILYYLVENKLGRLIGPLFELKVGLLC